MHVPRDPSLPAPGDAHQFFPRKHPDGEGCWTTSREAYRCHSGTVHIVGRNIAETQQPALTRQRCTVGVNAGPVGGS